MPASVLRLETRHKPRREDAPMPKTSRQTLNKLNRERELKEKRALKQERKEQKKLAAAEAATAEAETSLGDTTA